VYKVYLPPNYYIMDQCINTCLVAGGR